MIHQVQYLPLHLQSVLAIVSEYCHSISNEALVCNRPLRNDLVRWVNDKDYNTPLHIDDAPRYMLKRYKGDIIELVKMCTNVYCVNTIEYLVKHQIKFTPPKGYCNVLIKLLSSPYRYGAAIIKYLLNNGIDTNCKTETRDTPFIVAWKNRQPLDVLQCLIDHNKDAINDVDVLGNNMLMLMYRDDTFDRERAQFLVDNGININHANSYDHTAIMIACTRCNVTEHVQFLIDVGADISDRRIIYRLQCYKLIKSTIITR